MSKARSMYAGSSGSNYGVNKNSPGNGNGKWQGLWPSVGHARNVRYINTRAGGDNRNVVFCMNQLGGVGKISNMFATTADGVKDCKNGCILPSNIKDALQQLTNYAAQKGNLLCLVGVNETLSGDIPGHSGSFDKSFPGHLQGYVHAINNLGLEFAVTGPNDVQRHVVAMVTPPDAKVLKAYGFGFPALCNSIIAYGSDCDGFNPSFTFDDKGFTFKFSLKDPFSEITDLPTNVSKWSLFLQEGITIICGEGVKYFNPTKTELIKLTLVDTENPSLGGTGIVHTTTVESIKGTNNALNIKPNPYALFDRREQYDFEIFVPKEAMEDFSLYKLSQCKDLNPDPNITFAFAQGIIGGARCLFHTPDMWRKKTCAE